MKLLLAAFPPELGNLLENPPEGWVAVCTDVGALPRLPRARLKT